MGSLRDAFFSNTTSPLSASIKTDAFADTCGIFSSAENTVKADDTHSTAVSTNA
jgi:hypothetical protein